MFIVGNGKMQSILNIQNGRSLKTKKTLGKVHVRFLASVESCTSMNECNTFDVLGWKN